MSYYSWQHMRPYVYVHTHTPLYFISLQMAADNVVVVHHTMSLLPPLDGLEMEEGLFCHAHQSVGYLLRRCHCLQETLVKLSSHEDPLLLKLYLHPPH